MWPTKSSFSCTIIRKKNTRSQCHVNLSMISKEINSLCRLLKLTIGLKVTAKSQVRPADITPGGSKLMKRKRKQNGETNHEKVV